MSERFAIKWINPLAQLGYVEMTCVVEDLMGEIPPARYDRSWQMAREEVTPEFLAAQAEEICASLVASWEAETQPAPEPEAQPDPAQSEGE